MSYSDVVNGVVVSHSREGAYPTRTPKGVWYKDKIVNPSYDEVTQSRLGPFFTLEGNFAVYTYVVNIRPDALARKAEDINTKVGTVFDSKVSLVTSGYTDKSIETWDLQRSEALAYDADVNAPTPLVDSLAIARGITKEDLVGRILAKATAFAGVMGALLGNQQRIEDLVALAVDADDMEELERIEADELEVGWAV